MERPIFCLSFAPETFLSSMICFAGAKERQNIGRNKEQCLLINLFSSLGNRTRVKLYQITARQRKYCSLLQAPLQLAYCQANNFLDDASQTKPQFTNEDKSKGYSGYWSSCRRVVCFQNSNLTTTQDEAHDATNNTKELLSG
jgi:hypothetical protein